MAMGTMGRMTRMGTRHSRCVPTRRAHNIHRVHIPSHLPPVRFNSRDSHLGTHILLLRPQAILRAVLSLLPTLSPASLTAVIETAASLVRLDVRALCALENAPLASHATFVVVCSNKIWIN
jgi:hypothetical protein